MTDFVGLCRAARELPGQDTSDRLWSAWFALPQWHLLAAPSPVGTLPFSNFVDGQRSVLAFTSANGAANYAAAMRVGPPMALVPDAVIQRVPQLKSFGVGGFLVDVGPNGFMTSLDQLWSMFHRFRAPPAPPPPPSGPAPGTVAWFRALPAWHVVVTAADRSVPELVSDGGDLVAQVFSSPQAMLRFAGRELPSTVMPPAQALAWLADMELVKWVKLDHHLIVDLVDLQMP